MAAFTRSQRRFECHGVHLNVAMDACPPGKYPILHNVRSIVQGTLQERQGLTAVPGTAFGAAIHSLMRFDDPTPFASVPSLYVVGAGTSLYAGQPNGPFPSVDTGYSGNPLSLTVGTPPQSPQPWLYVSDRSRLRKTNANGQVFQWGIAPPTVAPSAVLAPLGINILEQFDATLVGWVKAGAQASNLGAAVFRVNTGITYIQYDSGNPGWASIAPTLMNGIDDGMLLIINNVETVEVSQTTIAVATTTIAGILYDSGSTGLCTIQPAASLGTGQLDAPSLFDYETRFLGVPHPEIPFFKEAADQLNAAQGASSAGGTAPAPALGGRIRQIDFPVNALVTLGGGETVRILSVAIGQDGIQSFRCSTVGTHTVGESIVGVPAFRAYVTGLYTGGESLIDRALFNIITPIVTVADQPASATGGVQTGAGWVGADWSTIAGRATLPDDEIHLAINISNCVEVETVRLYLDVDVTTNDFTQNYFFAEWRASDIISAIQATNADPTASLQAARTEVVQNAQFNSAALIHRAVVDAKTGVTSGRAAFIQGLAREQVAGAAEAAADAAALSSPLALGNFQWIELTCRVSNLVHVGTDPSRTLANIKAAEVLVSIQGPNAVQVAYDGIWLSGGFGPDVAQVGAPYVYATRYRSSATGGKSNPSPPMRGGMLPHRQRVSVTPTASSDPQVDLIDYFRVGGALTQYTYVGTGPNTSAAFNDDLSDSSISDGEILTYDQFQPWPTQDKPRTGTCNVVGTSVQWVSGDTFNTAWAPGSLVLINGRAYTFYDSPSSTTRLTVNENAGVGTGVPFTVTGPTLLQQNLAVAWSGSLRGATFLFGCGDAINPGQVHWTNGNDSESTSDRNTLDVTSASDPLQNGFVYDGTPYVFSTESLFALELNPLTGDSASAFIPIVTPCGRGLWTLWAFALAPDGVYFLAKDGIYVTKGGSVAQSITDADLYALFPHEGVSGQAVNGYQPVDMTQINRLRLSYVDGWVFFDYVDAGGAGQSLAYWVADKSWWPDTFTPGMTLRAPGLGPQIHQMLMAGSTGTLYTPAGPTDNGAAFTALVQVVDDQQDARRQKIYRDLMLDAQRNTGIAVTASVNNGATVVGGPNVLPGVAGRVQQTTDVVPTTGAFGTNLTAQYVWTPGANPTVLFVWDVAYQPAPELATSWLSGPTTHGLRGFQAAYQGLFAYLSTTPVTLSVIVDGVLYTYTLPNTNGRYAKNKAVLQAIKGKTFQWGAQATAPFLWFDQDIEIWVNEWGSSDGYKVVRPF